MGHISVTSPPVCLVALGANLSSGEGPPQVTLRLALERLGDSGLVPVAVSRFFSTPCFPAGAGPDYVNAAVRLTSDIAPEAVLEVLHGVEAAFGRARVQRWGSRTLDLDLIAIGDSVLPDAETQARWRGMSPDALAGAAPDRLILPHPRLQDRAFVLVPLCDVAPDWRHPLLGRTVREMADALPEADRMAVKAL